jgi:hypothetical protein
VKENNDMYQKAGIAVAAGTTGGLAMTGANVLWLVLAGFALLAAGTAVARIAPKRRRTDH